MSKNSHTNTPGPSGSAPPPPQQQIKPTTSTQPTDSYIPPYLTNLVPSLHSYEELKQMEKKLDIYLARKRIDLHQSVSQWNNSKSSPSTSINNTQYLRVFISNVSENQPWQIDQNSTSAQPSNTDDATHISNPNQSQQQQNPLKEAPSWTMRVEGRLLNDQAVDDPNRPKFSSFIQAIAVDFKRPEPDNDEDEDVDMTSDEANSDSINSNNNSNSNNNDTNSLNLTLPLQLPQQSSNTNNPNSNQQPSASTTNKTLNNSDNITGSNVITDAVEWQYDPKKLVEFDGLDIKRSGSENIQCTVTIQLRNTTGSRLEYSPELSSIIGIRKGSLHDAVYSLYKYILINNLIINNENENNSSSLTFGSNNDKTNGDSTFIQLNADLLNLLPDNSPLKRESTAILEDLINNSQLDNDMENSDSQNNNQQQQHQQEKQKQKLPTIKLPELLPLINNHIFPLRPIKVDYTIRTDRTSTYGDVVFDVEVPKSAKDQELGDLVTDGMSLLSEFNQLSNDLKPKLQTLDSQLGTLHLELNASAAKYQFFSKLADDPVSTLQEYIASTANALKVLSGDEGFNEDTVRRSQFYLDNEDVLFENLGVLLANGRM